MAAKRGGDTPEFKHKVVEDAIKKAFKPHVNTPEENLVERAKQLTNDIRNQIKPILAAGGWKDKEALRATICTLYVSAFDSSFTKDDLVQICTMLHSELMMETIDADPFGSGSPDLLST